jgi:hypothetical protein
MNARGQANLISFAAAVVLISAVTVSGVIVAEEALSDVVDQSQEERVASLIAAHLVADAASHTRRHGVLQASASKSLTAADLTTAVPSFAGRSARVVVHDTRLLIAGRRQVTRSSRVLIESYTHVLGVYTCHVPQSQSSNISLAGHAGNVTVSILPTTNRTVHTIRADGRVLRHNPGGLSTRQHHLSLPRRPVNLSIVSTGNNSGQLMITWQTANTTLAWVEVHVGE